MGKCASAPQDLCEPTTAPAKSPAAANSNQNAQLCSKRFLKDEMPNWFPSQNAHKDISSNFTLKATLGRGETGKVFSVFYEPKKQMCALKRSSRSDEFGSIQFATEARCLRKISHPNIIKYIDVLMDDEYYYLLLEQCDTDLWTRMSSQKQFSETECKRLLYPLLKAVAHIHKKNLVHRDIKPENIVLCDNDLSLPKLIDFGDAEMAKNDKIYSEFVGTPPYMSPERLTQHNAMALKKSDIWAIGVMAFELYTGQRCFEGQSQKIVFGKILKGEWEWPLERMPSVQFRTFVRGCLDMSLEMRYNSEMALKDGWFADLACQSANVNAKTKKLRAMSESENVTSALEVCDFVGYSSQGKTETEIRECIDDYDTMGGEFESEIE